MEKENKKEKIFKTYFTINELFCIIIENNGENYLVVQSFFAKDTAIVSPKILILE